jgi:site-specific DNA-cytosine methylase
MTSSTKEVRYAHTVSGGALKSSVRPGSAPAGFDVVDIFSCTGVLAAGVAAGGGHIVSGFELDPDRAAHFRANTNAPCVEGDVFENLDILAGYRGVDLAVICPPCQGFSSAGKRDALDPRNELLRRVPELLEILRPRWVMVENVTRALYVGETGPVVAKVRELGYRTTDGIVQLADYGCPQMREHWFLWASLDEPIGPPPGTHGQDKRRRGQLRLGLEPWVPCSGIMEQGQPGIPHDLLIRFARRRYFPRRHRERVRSLYPDVTFFAREHARNQFTTVVVDPTTDLLARVTGSFGRAGDCLILDGPVIRYPLFEEAARAQDIPDGWSLGPTREKGWQQIGDAVPMRFGRAVAEMLSDRTSRRLAAAGAGR